DIPTASVAVSPSEVTEDGATSLGYTVTLSHASAFDTTVNFTVGGSASEGTDYTGVTVTHSTTILANTLPGTITVDPTTDAVFEGNETVVVTLTDGSTNGQAIAIASGAAATATGTITDAADIPTASVAVSPSEVTEDGATSLVYTVTLSHAS